MYVFISNKYVGPDQTPHAQRLSRAYDICPSIRQVFTDVTYAPYLEPCLYITEQGESPAYGRKDRGRRLCYLQTTHHRHTHPTVSE